VGTVFEDGIFVSVSEQFTPEVEEIFAALGWL
jgi:hypothetical protein